MVKRLRVAGWGLVVAATLLATACTPEPTPSTSPSPAMTPSASPTPTENAQERQQRLDQEAAANAYLASNKELDRLSMRGGATEPTPVLRATTGGVWQDGMMNALKIFKKNGWRTDRPGIATVVADGGWSPSEIGLTACEDSSKVKFLDTKGHEVFKHRDTRYVQTLTATKVDGKWKITDGKSKAVKTFEHVPGCSA